MFMRSQPFCALQAADAICSNFEPSMLTQQQANEYRNVIFTRLKERLTSACCGSPLCVKPTGTVHWVACDNCFLWHHYKCEKVGVKPDGNWFCASCTAAGRS